MRSITAHVISAYCIFNLSPGVALDTINFTSGSVSLNGLKFLRFAP